MRKALTLALRATAEALIVCGMCAGLFGCFLMDADLAVGACLLLGLGLAILPEVSQ